jgi:hypothetical protein
MVLILIVVLALTAGTVVSTQAVTAQSANTTDSNQSQASSGTAVSIAENQTTRDEVELKSVTLPENGYIVVQNDTNVSSASGVVAHTQYVRSGQFEDVVIGINETVTNGTILRVAVHNETNGNEKFDFVNSSGSEDGPVEGSDGTPISDMVRVSANASESNGSAETTTNRTNANSTASPTATPSNSSSESRYADVRPGSASAQSGSSTTTPTATPTPAATSTSTTERSQPPNETANASVGGGQSGGELAGSGGGVSARESGGIGGVVGLSPTILLLGGVMAVLAVAEMIVVGESPSRWFRIPAFSGSLPSLSAMISRSQSEQREEDDAAESADSHDEDGDQPSLTAIQQVGDDRASTLREAGFESVEDVATASQNALTDVEGIGGARGEAIAESANSLLDGNSSETVDDAPADVAEDGDTHSGAGEAAAGSEAGREDDEKQTSVVANARASLAEIARRVYGHTRMLFDRRALEPRAYGATDDWTALTFDCSDLDDSEPVRELLEETVYIGEVPVEIAGEATDRAERRLSAESSVRVPREGIERVEQAAQDDNPEAKRTVTLLRRALRAEEERAIRGSSG